MGGGVIVAPHLTPRSRTPRRRRRPARTMKAATLDAEGRIKTSAAPAEVKKIPNPLHTDKNVIAGFTYLGQVLNGTAANAGPNIANLGPVGPKGGGGGGSPMAHDLYFM